ncbi:NupC/NupG family nucleoside CNT transporter [Limnoglobus roseus]|uniref:Na+ dependent nucleoside transporter domain protein n=1 Tax=Limnoglobus roseus TaxID=2598579 RepID=A0A5C1ABU2_9BACT|nr:nucleoside transporter C-terminal domain-containing protein [Limnoglobus roseus]QEL15643.1 Na+ dependent nucleoside transporter domain protein [Limnoglobus roseus]
MSTAPTPLAWRLGLFGLVAGLTATASFGSASLGPRGQAVCGLGAFLALAAGCSQNLRNVNARTIVTGILLQFLLAYSVLHVEWVKTGFEWVGGGIKKLVECSDKGAEFVFGDLAKVRGPLTNEVGAVLGGPGAFVTQQRNTGAIPFHFAFRALPPIIFISSFFSVLYYFGVLQLLVKLFARVMMYLMGTSGAETLSVSANVFMGQTEAPLIVKPFVPKMTQSELLALMASGMAHISGGMMAVYISYGADPVSILCTCVMACPCSLYLTKLVLPETETPETMGNATVVVPKVHANAIDAAAGGVKDGLMLALNVAAMLIGFLAFIALFDVILGSIKPTLIGVGLSADRLEWIPDKLSLQMIFGWLFAPVAVLIGVDPDDSRRVGTLLGIKLAANEHVAYLTLKDWTAHDPLGERSRLLAVYALTGFANFSSIGIQLGGIGAMAENRRGDLARLGMKALFIGYLATLVNAAVAGLLMAPPTTSP